MLLVRVKMAADVLSVTLKTWFQHAIAHAVQRLPEIAIAASLAKYCLFAHAQHFPLLAMVVNLWLV